MSNFQNSNIFLNNINTKYSLDEIEISENNTTHNDSLHKEKIISKTTHKNYINEEKQKQLNYCLALNTIQKKFNDSFHEISLNEFSDINLINAKEKNVIKYIKNPLKKEVFKIGNILKTLKSQQIKQPLKNYNNAINRNIPIVTEEDEEYSSTIINETKNTKSLTASNQRDKNMIHYINNNINTNKNLIKEYNGLSTTVTKNKNLEKKSNSINNKNNNNLINNNGIVHKLDIINDLEESFEIKINDINKKKEKNFSNNLVSNQMVNQYFDLDTKKFAINKNKLFNSRIFKSLDFRNIRKNGINYSIHEVKHIKKWSNVDIILKNKTKTTTGKKLRKKYERSELKSNKYHTNSLNQNNKIYPNNSSKNDIYIKEDINNYKYLSNEKLAKNLMGKFNMCSQVDDLLGNMIFNINESNYEEEINNDKVEFIDFLSNESGKQNNNIISKEDYSNNNDTFIIKTYENGTDLEKENGTSCNIKNKIMSENKTRKNSYNLNFSNNNFNNLTKSIENYNSPIKLKEFSLLPNGNGNNYKSQKSKLILDKNYNNQNENSSNSIMKRNKSQNLLNIIPIEQDQNKILDLSDSPSYINTASPRNLENTSNKNLQNNKSLDNKCQFQHRTIYDLEFYQNLLIANNSYKKINFQNIFKSQPLLNWEIRLNTLLWMMKICEEFAFKRDTYHYSSFYFDLFLYLSNEKIENKNEFKLIGITCISISAKIEEVQIPKLVEYAESINDCNYKIDDIINTEKKICGALGWKLIPMTISSWLNWYTCQWDLFVNSVDNILEKLLLLTDDDNILFFKRQNEISYYNYRRIYQLIDLIILDYHSYKHEIRYLIASCFLISICLHYNLEYDFKEKILKIKKFSKKLKKNEKEKGKVLLEIYIQFIEQSFDFSFEDKKLIECINYIYKFINFKFSYDVPLIFQVEQENLNDYSYEDFISYQTTCDNIYPFFKEIHKKEIKKTKNKKFVKINKNLPINKNNRKSQSSLGNQSTLKTRKSFSSRKSSLTKDNSKNKISNL